MHIDVGSQIWKVSRGYSISTRHVLSQYGQVVIKSQVARQSTQESESEKD